MNAVEETASGFCEVESSAVALHRPAPATRCVTGKRFLHQPCPTTCSRVNRPFSLERNSSKHVSFLRPMEWHVPAVNVWINRADLVASRVLTRT